jgi:hypothetical protein
MTNLEIALNILAEASAAELSKQRDPKRAKASSQGWWQCSQSRPHTIGKPVGAQCHLTVKGQRLFAS